LGLLRLSYWGFDHTVHQSEMVVNASAGASLTRAFAFLFAAQFPIRQMRVVDDFGGGGERSMLAARSLHCVMGQRISAPALTPARSWVSIGLRSEQTWASS
jgi:hypothetical protein